MNASKLISCVIHWNQNEVYSCTTCTLHSFACSHNIQPAQHSTPIIVCIYRLLSINEKKEKLCVCVCLSHNEHSLTHAHAIIPPHGCSQRSARIQNGHIFSFMSLCGFVRSLVVQLVHWSHTPFNWNNDVYACASFADYIILFRFPPFFFFVKFLCPLSINTYTSYAQQCIFFSLLTKWLSCVFNI